ncbi:ABC transporter substrate-binding protein [Puia dinghuensis]|uniref:Peptide ABC transporter substrate-binding protein n=1 Tax=Puia dinghuensis TaxID=1792502 RepID=A0A8J2XSR6_9BACT|nr:ABC transporter substrate-binding protein [Puia dinghuensis]GGA97141.1 peptide ABC transporter substrate-binding protein [Puia dinghuensis]
MRLIGYLYFAMKINNPFHLSLLPIILVSAACHAPSSSSHKKIFTYNESDGIATLDPAFAKNRSIMWAVHQLYSTLVATDDKLNIVPDLARSWETSADRKTWTFRLRTDVFFHDDPAFPGGQGRRLTAADIVYSFNRLLDPATASSGAWIFHDRIDTTNPFTATNDSTFQLKLIRPFNPILGLFSMEYCSAVPREAVEHYGKDFRSHPCGTGPFRIKSWEENQTLIFIKNDRYFEHDSAGRPLPYLDAVKITFNDEKATEFLQFVQGQLDFINEIDPSFKDEVLSKKGQLKKDWQGKIILSVAPQLNTEYLGILVDSTNPLVEQSPLKLKQVRQAINYGFDRRKMMLYLRNSLGLPAESGFVPAGLPSFDSTKVHGYHYDPEKARALLSAAGYPGGKGLPPIRLLTIPIYGDFATFIARQLEDIGIHINLEIVQKSLLLEETAQSKALFFRGSWIADYPDAENYLSVFYSKNPAPPNYTRYSDPVFDRLYEQSLLENTDSGRYRLYREMDQRVIDAAPVVPLWYDEVVHLINPRIRGLNPNALNLLELRHVDIVAH